MPRAVARIASCASSESNASSLATTNIGRQRSRALRTRQKAGEGIVSNLHLV